MHQRKGVFAVRIVRRRFRRDYEQQFPAIPRLFLSISRSHEEPHKEQPKQDQRSTHPAPSVHTLPLLTVAFGYQSALSGAKIWGPPGLTRVHSITWSARSSTEGGMVKPSAWAVFMLITSSNFVGCSMGRAPGLAPLRILSTYPADRRIWSS